MHSDNANADLRQHGQTADMKVDGNAIGGLLAEIFNAEMTAAEGTCGGCGAVNALGRVDVYMNAPGVVVRCPSCTHVLMLIVRGPDRFWLDLSGVRGLEVRLP